MGGINLYGFVYNSPTGFIDEFGLKTVESYMPQRPQKHPLSKSIPRMLKSFMLDCNCKIQIDVKDASFFPTSFRAAQDRADQIQMMLDFDYKLVNPDDCKSCHILVVQSIRREKRDRDGNWVPRQDQPSARADISDKKTGWGMDWPAGYERDRIPYWSYLPLSTAAAGDGSSGSYWDPPGVVTTGDGVRVMTCFIREKIGGSTEIIGCLEWGFYLESRGSRYEFENKKPIQRTPYDTRLLPGTPKRHCGKTTGLSDAVNGWNKGKQKAEASFIPF
jgi:hypothetical protein